MRNTMLSLAAAVACLTLAVGCSQNSNIVRGQAPEYGPAPQFAEECYPEDYCEVDDDCDYCHGRGCCHCRCRPYCVPGDLVYPPPGDGPWGNAPAIVQYPYYTNKGPDCFFHQQ